MNSNTSLVILAAGLGTRFGGDKQTCTIGNSNEFLLEYNIHNALQAGVKKIVIVVSASNKAFLAANLTYLSECCEIKYAVQDLEVTGNDGTSYLRTKPWGTGHAVLTAGKYINDRVIIINADDYYGSESFQQAVDFISSSDPGMMGLVAFQLKNTLSENGGVSRGICESDAEGNLLSVSEQEKIERNGNDIVAGTTFFTGNECVSMNFWILNKAFFNYLEKEFHDFLKTSGSHEDREFQLPVLIDTSIRERLFRFRLMETSSSWFGLTYLDDVPDVKHHLRIKAEKGEYPFDLRKTV